MRQLPPINAIRVFEAAARHENFTQAAAELGLTQSAVSHQIRLLEQRLALSLFTRAKGRVSLSDAGRRIAPQLSAAFDIMDEALGTLTSDESGLLSISTSPIFGTIWLAPRLGGFQVAHQELAVRLSTDPRFVDFSSGEFHAAIRLGPGGWPGLRQHFLCRLHFSPMCTPEFAARHRLERPEQLLDVPRFSAAARWWREWFEGAGVPAPQAGAGPSLVLDNQVLEANAALGGTGIAMLTPFLWRAELESGRLVQPFPYVHCSRNSHWLVYPETRRNQAKIVAFREWLLRTLREAAAGEPAEPFAEAAAVEPNEDAGSGH